jgi:hypothetical protein
MSEQAKLAEIEEGAGCDFEAAPGPEWIAFAMWRCHCTTLAATIQEIPAKCPNHGMPLIDRPEWTENPHRVPLHDARPAAPSPPTEGEPK